VKRIAFFVNGSKPEADAVRERLAARAAAEGLVESADPEVVIALGGDGTMLAAVHAYPGVPLLGLNLGSLGYLAGVEEPSFNAALHALATDAFRLSKRTLLEVDGRRALNDVVLSKGVSGRAAVMEFSVDGRPATRFSADGLILATPTGSTAYSLSAGGPILLPDSASFAVTPICPHALASRPLVVPDTARLSVRLLARPGADSLKVFADGQEVGTLGGGEELVVRKADAVVTLVELEGCDPWTLLARKLGWTGSLRK